MLDLTQIEIKKEAEDKNFGRFIIEPLDPGFGQTLGVSLRRILLSSLEGGAITQIKISGVRHQFSSLKGVAEDVVEFILNLKQVRLIIPDDKPVKLTLNATGSNEVKAKNIICPGGVEITNPDLVLAHLADSKTKLNATFVAERGSGYSLAEERKTNEIGVIPIDASFSPVKRVNYKVDLTRVGRVTNYDKLTLGIWTDGTITPSDALKEASKILVSRAKIFYEPPQLPKAKKPTVPQIGDDVLKTTLEELDLPVRVVNTLKKGKIVTIGDFLSAPKRKLLSIKNLGPKSVTMIAEKLGEKEIPVEQIREAKEKEKNEGEKES